MRNKVILLLVGLIFFLGTYKILYMMYVVIEPTDFGIGDDTTNVEFASYLYFFSAIIMSLLVIFLKNITLIAKRVLTSIATIFYTFSWILALITFYSSPNNRVEVLAGAIFLLAGSVFLATSFFIRVKEKRNEKKELGIFHKLVRYVLVFILSLMLLRTLVKIAQIMPFLSVL
jgi:hypothetical protein